MPVKSRVRLRMLASTSIIIQNAKPQTQSACGAGGQPDALCFRLLANTPT